MKTNNIIPYIGAGISVLSEKETYYPLWNHFLNNTLHEFCPNIDKEEFDKLKVEDKASLLIEEMGKITFGEHLKEIYGEQHLEDSNLDLSKTAAYLIPSIFPNSLIITTNYDHVIEKMYQLHSKLLTVAHPHHHEALNRALRENNLLLFKIHGDICEPFGSIILTKQQYDEAYSDTSLTASLASVFRGKSLLFLGCCLGEDRPLHMMTEVLQDGMINYTIIQSDPDSNRDNRIRLENRYNTLSILYPSGEHSCVNVILERMKEMIISTNQTVLHIDYEELSIYRTNELINYGQSEAMRYKWKNGKYVLNNFRKGKTFKHFVLCNIEEKEKIQQIFNSSENYILTGDGELDEVSGKCKLWFVLKYMPFEGSGVFLNNLESI